MDPHVFSDLKLLSLLPAIFPGGRLGGILEQYPISSGITHQTHTSSQGKTLIEVYKQISTLLDGNIYIHFSNIYQNGMIN